MRTDAIKKIKRKYYTIIKKDTWNSLFPHRLCFVNPYGSELRLTRRPRRQLFTWDYRMTMHVQTSGSACKLIKFIASTKYNPKTSFVTTTGVRVSSEPLARELRYKTTYACTINTPAATATHFGLHPLNRNASVRFFNQHVDFTIKKSYVR